LIGQQQHFRYTRVNVLNIREYTFSVKSVDLAGNESLSVATNVVSIDTTPPTATTIPVEIHRSI
jgi:formylmethanofuran dehydrogenase subunit A